MGSARPVSCPEGIIYYKTINYNRGILTKSHKTLSETYILDGVPCWHRGKMINFLNIDYLSTIINISVRRARPVSCPEGIILKIWACCQHAPGMLRACSGHAPGMLRERSGHAPGTLERCSEHNISMISARSQHAISTLPVDHQLL